MKKILLPTIMSKILEVSENSYYRWKSKDHKILINLIETYHSKEDLQEFIETGKIQKQELIKKLTISDLNSLNNLKEQLILDEIKRKKIEIKELKLRLNSNKDFK